MNHVETLNLRPGETVGMFGPDAAFLTTLPEHFGRVVGGSAFAKATADGSVALRQASAHVVSPARERGGCGADGDKYAGDVRDATGSATPVAGAPGSCSSGLHAGVSRHDTPPFRLRYSSGGQVRAGLGGGPDIPGALGLSGTTTATGTGTASRSQSPTDCDPPGRTTPLANFARLVAQTRLDGNGQQGQSPSGAVPCYGGGISGTGDVEGPATSTDNAIARYDGTTGKVIQNSAARIDDSGNLVADGSVTAKVQLRSEDGVVSKPGHAFVNDQATGMYREPGVLAFSVEGVSKLLLKKAGSDHIIAGNTTLQGNLTIDGDVTADNIGDVAAQGDGDKGDITVSSGGGTWTIDANAVTDAKLRDSAALSVIGRGANSTGDPADIAAGSDHQVLRRSGTSLGFGALNLGQSNAVTSQLPIANGGTGAATADSAINVIASNASNVSPDAANTRLLARIGTMFTQGGYVTPQQIYNLINSLEAETIPIAADKLPLYDASAGKADSVTWGTLISQGKARFYTHNGTGSSGATLPLGGINRACLIIWFGQSSGTSYDIHIGMPFTFTGTLTMKNTRNSVNSTVLSLDAPAAGAQQTLTINSTNSNWNASGQTYNCIVIGTSI